MMFSYVRYNGHYYICHAEVRGSWEAISYFSREQTEAFLNKLKSQEDFNFKIPDDFEPQSESSTTPNPKSYVKIELKNYDYSYVVMMGTLIKGLNEHRRWAYDAMMADGAYFRNAFKKLQEVTADKKIGPNRLGGHQYIPIKYNYRKDGPPAEPYPMRFKVRTIRGLFRRHTRLGSQGRGGTIWSTYLGEPIIDERF